MRVLEEQAEALRERDPALALQKGRELRKLADELQENDVKRRADDLIARVDKYLFEAQQLKVKADELEKLGQVREAAKHIERLIFDYPNTEAAKNALFPLEIVTRPPGVKVTQKPNKVVGVTEAGKPLILRMRQGEVVRLLFERTGYAKQEYDVQRKTLGKLEVPLLEKLDLFVRRVGLAVSSDPVLSGPTLYVPAESRLYALEVNPFRFLWSAPLEGSMEGSPAVTKDFVVAATTQRRLMAFARANGELKKAWQAELPDRPTATPAPSNDGTLLYVPTADRMLRAIVLRTGEEKWVREMPGYTSFEPIATEQGVILGGTDGTVVCVRGPGADDEVWKIRTEGAVSSMVLTEGTLYVTGADQSLCAIDPVRGQQTWRRILPAGATGRPLRLEGTVLVGTKDGKVHFRDAATGEPMATYETQGAIVGGLARVGTLALFTSEDSYLYAFDLSARSLAWRYKAEGRIRTPPVVGEGRVYFVAGESLYAIELN
jgi:outer membrane protein assembly factor BamB